MAIRKGVASDSDDIANCTYAAFKNGAEVRLIEQLRTEGDVLFELVAQLADAVVGHVLVSKLKLSPDVGLRCAGVAPLSVLPPHQSGGVGSGLMREVLAQSRLMGLDVLFLLGDPSYYKRFGFQATSILSDYPSEYFQACELTPHCLSGVKARAHYANAFSSL